MTMVFNDDIKRRIFSTTRRANSHAISRSLWLGYKARVHELTTLHYQCTTSLGSLVVAFGQSCLTSGDL